VHVLGTVIILNEGKRGVRERSRYLFKGANLALEEGTGLACSMKHMDLKIHLIWYRTALTCLKLNSY